MLHLLLQPPRLCLQQPVPLAELDVLSRTNHLLVIGRSHLLELLVRLLQLLGKSVSGHNGRAEFLFKQVLLLGQVIDLLEQILLPQGFAFGQLVPDPPEFFLKVAHPV
jgi:hypothetical protein